MEQPSHSGPVPQPSWSLDDLPTKVACTLSQGSNVTSMDFHPSCRTLLLVGSANGEFTLWEIGMCERLVSKPFQIWDMQACSAQFQCVMAKDSSMAVSRVTWSPDGYMIGVAFTKHLIHLHAYEHRNETRKVVEIEAHSGGVNDIAFSRPNKQLCVVTWEDDKFIRVWDMHGQKIYSFEGHEAPVYSIRPHHIDDIQFIFSTSLDGKIKAWLYDNVGSRVDSDVPGKWCTAMLYSADGTRLFSCGTSKEGDSHLVEWNQSEGSVKRSYSGFRKKPSGVLQGVVQFDIAQNHILAAGEDNQIKFWDVDNTNMLTCIEVGGALPSFPRLRFNKEGNLLAVTTVDNGFKIIANTGGLKSLPAFGNLPSEVFRSPYEASAMKVSGAPVVAGISPNIGQTDHLDRNYPAKPSPILNGSDPASGSIDKKRRISEEKSDKEKPWDLKEVLNPQEFRLARMPETDRASKLPQGVEYGDRDTMLAQAEDASGVYLIHAKKLQLHIWLHKGDNWLLVDTICLREMVANLRIPGYEVEDETTAPLRIKHVGDYAEFMFLEMGRCALHLDVKCRQLRKVYVMAEEELHLGDIHPFTMIWPPIFPALKDNPASSLSSSTKRHTQLVRSRSCPRMLGRSGYTDEGGDSIVSWPRYKSSSTSMDRIVDDFDDPKYLLFHDKAAQRAAKEIFMEEAKLKLELEGSKLAPFDR